jgi:hypothetical protein
MAGYCEYSCRYDFYSPKTNFIFHHYYREGAPKSFELGGGGEAERCSAARPLHRAPWNATCSATCNMTHHTPSQVNATRTAAYIPHRTADCASPTPARAAHRTARNGPART